MSNDSVLVLSVYLKRIHISCFCPFLESYLQGMENATVEEMEQDRFGWKMRKRAMTQAIQVIPSVANTIHVKDICDVCHSCAAPII
jgi:hypothetical protein